MERKQTPLEKPRQAPQMKQVVKIKPLEMPPLKPLQEEEGKTPFKNHFSKNRTARHGAENENENENENEGAQPRPAKKPLGGLLLPALNRTLKSESESRPPGTPRR